MVRDFIFEGVGPSGKKKKGRKAFRNRKDAKEHLRQKGLTRVKIRQAHPVWDFEFDVGLDGAVKLRHQAMLVDKLSSMTKSGLPILDCLALLQQQAATARLVKILDAVLEDVSTGSSLHAAFGRFPKAFGSLLISMVKAGEESGRLEHFLGQLSEILRRDLEIQSKVRSAMIYPAVMILVTVGIVSFMLIQVVPTFVEMYEGMGSELPAMTQAIVSLSDFLIKGGAVALVAAAAALTFLQKFCASRFLGYRRLLAGFALLMPLQGKLIVQSSVARSAMLIAALSEAGVSLEKVLSLAADVMPNQRFKDAYLDIAKRIVSGYQLSELFERHSVFPDEVSQLVAIGEKTGAVEQLLKSLAEYYQSEVAGTVDGLIKLIEPLMIVVIGGLIGGLIMALYLPIFGMANTV